MSVRDLPATIQAAQRRSSSVSNVASRRLFPLASFNSVAVSISSSNVCGLSTEGSFMLWKFFQVSPSTVTVASNHYRVWAVAAICPSCRSRFAEPKRAHPKSKPADGRVELRAAFDRLNTTGKQIIDRPDHDCTRLLDQHLAGIGWPLSWQRVIYLWRIASSSQSFA